MRFRYLLLVAALFGSVFTAPTYALPSQVKSIDAPWVYLYAENSKSGSVTKELIPKTTSADKAITKSLFQVDYTNTPATYHPAIAAAANVWSENFTSTVPVKVKIIWERQASTQTLAAASPGKFHSNFKNIPDKELWYASALADSLAGEDIEPSLPEVVIRINSTNGPSLYLGVDGNCPSNKYDLFSMILHEMAHGLGFLSNSDYDQLFGYGSIQQPTPYDAYAQLPDGRRLMDLDSPSLELGEALTKPLVWSGANAVRANNGIKPALYTPAKYEFGSSISHLDEVTFSKNSSEVVMTPNLSNGEVFHQLGPMLLAMFDDLLAKPPAGLPGGLPSVPRNVKALVGAKSAIISFDPPANARTAQITSYVIRANQTDIQKVVTTGPTVISGLENGTTYSFTVIAKNALGESVGATTNAVIPQAQWRKSYVDSNADGKYFATGSYKGNTVIAYSDTGLGHLKLATWNGKKWLRQVIDGDSTKGGRTKNSVASTVSLCTYKTGSGEFLNLYYGDLTNKDLRRASFNGKKWRYEVIDGNGPTIQNFKEVDRVRTASDVSVSNACAVTPNSEQIFYRDESQGILLGAVRDGKEWRYEIVDGDNLLSGRTEGDVAFNLRAAVTGNSVTVLYDSVLSVSNSDKSVIRGEVRTATRQSAYPEDWKYQTIQSSVASTIVSGYSLALSLDTKVLNTGWLGASSISLPKPDQVQWFRLGDDSPPITAKTDSFGNPTAPVAVDNSRILFGCEGRICSLNKVDQTINLISSATNNSANSAAWITLKKVRYALLSRNGKLTLFRVP